MCDHLFSVGSAVVIDAVLSHRQADTYFLIALGIPADYTTMWNFVLPPKYYFTVDFVKYKMPQCQSKPVIVIYQQANMAAVENTLLDLQPSNYQGNSIVLEISVGSFLHFRVSVFRSEYSCRKILFTNYLLKLFF